VLGNLGTFMRDVASAWLVIELSNSATAVALVQAATTLPVFLLAIPAGVLSDILDRRRLLVAVQAGLAVVSSVLALFAWFGGHSVASLVGLTLLGGIGAALSMPTWQAIVPELVSKAELKGAVALNSLGINIARAVGPALGGLLLATLGAATTYAVDVLTYVVVLAALLWWPRAATPRDELSEHFGGALRAALRYAVPRRTCAACSSGPAFSLRSRARYGRCSRSSRETSLAADRACTVSFSALSEQALSAVRC
jgi:MFS family permease